MDVFLETLHVSPRSLFFVPIPFPATASSSRNERFLDYCRGGRERKGREIVEAYILIPITQPLSRKLIRV